ncbi:hypothetical protein BC628DRAFT_1371943, partial [Trametes gibbosa]
MSSRYDTAQMRRNSRYSKYHICPDSAHCHTITPGVLVTFSGARSTTSEMKLYVDASQYPSCRGEKSDLPLLSSVLPAFLECGSKRTIAVSLGGEMETVTLSSTELYILILRAGTSHTPSYPFPRGCCNLCRSIVSQLHVTMQARNTCNRTASARPTPSILLHRGARILGQTDFSAPHPR